VKEPKNPVRKTAAWMVAINVVVQVGFLKYGLHDDGIQDEVEVGN
jgi:hypothetical protein